jgi:hypothetical protein
VKVSRLGALGALAVLVLITASALYACGTDVSLGGGGDSGAPAVEAGIDGGFSQVDLLDCVPCATTSTCNGGSACASIDGGDGFCFAACDASAQCESDEACGMTKDMTGAMVLACIPKAGECPAAAPPKGPDGGTVDQCGTLVGPNVADAGCKDCHYECQKNGCYGGYYCNTKTKDCERPPESCF